MVARTPRAASTWRFEYRGQITRDNGTLEPTIKGCQLGATDSLAPGRRHCAESLYQKAKKRFGLSLGLALGETLSLALSKVLPLPGLAQPQQIASHILPLLLPLLRYRHLHSKLR